MIRVISIGTDRNIFTPNSAVAERMIEYGSIFGELHVVVFSLRSQSFSPIQLSPNVYIHPTNSSSRLRYIADAIRIGTEIGMRIYFGQSVISTQDPFETGVVGVFLKRRLRIPLQIQIHTDFYSKGFYDGSLFNWMRFELSRFVIRRGDAFRVVRDKIGQDLIKKCKVKRDKISVLPIWVDIEGIAGRQKSFDLKEKYPGITHFVLTSSRLTEEKHVGMILRVFASISERFPDTGLIVVGDGPLRLSLEKHARELKIEDRVHFEGWQRDIISYLKNADLFVNASRFEGFGMSIVEAVAAGCPVLTTNVGIVQDVFEDEKDAYICPVGNEKCFTNNMISFFENPGFQSGVSKSAFEKVRQFSITKEEYLKRYKEATELALKS
jgi:glycosyltransferase involved in cell wall biosynthesis